MRTVIAAADPSGFTAATFGFAGVLVGALATILGGIVNYREARSGQVTDRLTKAVEQLGSGNPQVRMGAVYALEQIVHDSKAPLIARWHSFVADRAPAMVRSPVRSTASRHRSYVNYVATLLAALVRSRSHLSDGGAGHGAVLKVRAPDVQAALTVLCRPPVCDDHGPGHQKGKLDLSRSDLSRARLRHAHLEKADLSSAHLQGTDLRRAYLQGAVLKEADLGPASRSRYGGGANLSRANLTGADLTGAILDRAILRGAVLDGVIWSRSTRWPEKELSQIRDRSTKIGRGKRRIDGPRAAKASPHRAGLAGPPAAEGRSRRMSPRPLYAAIRAQMSQISWRTPVPQQSTEDIAPGARGAELSRI
jgi:Pentapeptide repeats (8 copies)